MRVAAICLAIIFKGYAGYASRVDKSQWKIQKKVGNAATTEFFDSNSISLCFAIPTEQMGKGGKRNTPVSLLTLWLPQQAEPFQATGQSGFNSQILQVQRGTRMKLCSSCCSGAALGERGISRERERKGGRGSRIANCIQAGENAVKCYVE